MVEENVRLNTMEEEMKLVLNAIQNLTKQVESIHGKLTPIPAAVEVVLLPPSTEKDKASASDSKMPPLEDDPLPLAVRKPESEVSPVTKHDKRLVKFEEMLKQLQGPQNAVPLDLFIYKRVKVLEKFKMPRNSRSMMVPHALDIICTCTMCR
ncbi:hypothetical protein NL676_034356 [Syzygium grande]|nr:hypothetical protein NL676_034356 [Syzygium grande]